MVQLHTSRSACVMGTYKFGPKGEGIQEAPKLSRCLPCTMNALEPVFLQLFLLSDGV